MSKRFGRNQKRAMREQLAKAEGNIVSLRKAARGLEYQLHQHNYLIDSILAILPDHFCAVAAGSMEGIPDGQTRIELVKRLPSSAREFFGGPIDVRANRSAMFYALDILRIDLDNGYDPINFREMQHVVVSFKSKYVALAITPEALKYMPIEELSRDVAVLIKQHLTSKDGGGRNG